MNSALTRSALLAPVILLSLACAHKNKTETVPQEHSATATATQATAQSMDRDIVTTINFKKGQKAVNTTIAAEIDKALYEASKAGQVETVDVVVWSDVEYPAGGKELPRKQVQLASDRAENLERYIDKQSHDASVKTYNMAKEPSALGQLINSKDAKMKTRLTSMGFVPDAHNGFDSGRASTALVLIKVK